MTWGPPRSEDRVTQRPGWAPDPWQVAALRFHDGRVWTGYVHPPVQSLRPRRANPPVVSVLWSWLGLPVAFAASLAAAVLMFVVLLRSSDEDVSATQFELWAQMPLFVVAASVGLWFGFTLAFWGAVRATRLRYREAFGRCRRAWYVWAAVAAVGVQVALMVALSVLAPPSTPMFDVTEFGAVGVVLLGVVIVGGAPVFEELYFRGVLLPTLWQAWGSTPAVVVQGVLFGALHLDQGPLGVAVTGVVGCGLGWLRVRSAALGPCIVFHAVFNAVAFASLLAWA